MSQCSLLRFNLFICRGLNVHTYKIDAQKTRRVRICGIGKANTNTLHRRTTVHHPQRALSIAILTCFGLMAGCGADSPHGSCDDIPTPSTLRLTVQNGQYHDANGARVLLRGVNAGGRSKYPPFFPFAFQESGYAGQESAPPFDKALITYVDKVEDWGHNVVRLPFSWEAVEPERGHYDDAFLARLKTMITAFSDREIRVILEFHQDVFARTYCGDGFPLWATSFPDRALPAVEDCDDWFTAYLNTNNEVADEFARFWTNDDGLQDAMMAMWTYVLQEMHDVDGLIGVEAINEPWQGTLETDDWAANYMKPLVERFYDVVQDIDPSLLVFFGSAGTDTLNGKTVVHLPDRPNLSFAPHFYDPLVYILGTESGGWKPHNVLKNFFATGEEWQTPVLIGETGCKTAQARCNDYTRDVYDALDEYPLHATLWEYSTTTDDWNNEGFRLTLADGIESPAGQELARVYVASSTAQEQHFTFDAATRTATIDLNTTAPGWTKIVVPTRLYPNGYELTADGTPFCEKRKPNQLWIHATEAGTLQLSITPTH